MRYQKTTAGWNDLLRAKIVVTAGLLAVLESDLIKFFGSEKYIHGKANGINVNIYNPDGVVLNSIIDVVFQEEKIPENYDSEPKRRIYITTEPRGLEMNTEVALGMFFEFAGICEEGRERIMEIYKNA